MVFTPIQQQLDSIKKSPVREAKAVAEQVLSNPFILVEVVDCIRSDDPALRSRAARVVEIVGVKNPDIVQPYKKEILDELAWIDHWVVRAHLSKIVPLLNLNPKEVSRAFDLFEHYLSDSSSVVRTFAMQGMFDLLDRAPERITDVRILIESLMDGGTPAMRSRGRMLLVAIEELE